MIEYLYDAIKVTKGSEGVVVASITNDSGVAIAEDCEMILHAGDSMITLGGEFKDDLWHFTIPIEISSELSGRNWYCFRHGDEQLCFKQPIYFV